MIKIEPFLQLPQKVCTACGSTADDFQIVVIVFEPGSIFWIKEPAHVLDQLLWIPDCFNLKRIA